MCTITPTSLSYEHGKHIVALLTVAYLERLKGILQLLSRCQGFGHGGGRGCVVVEGWRGGGEGGRMQEEAIGRNRSSCSNHYRVV